MDTKSSDSRLVQVIVNLIGLVVTLVVNTLAVTLPLAGRSTAEISDSFAILFVPAGYVFSIWSLIYLALIGFSVFQALPGQQNNRWVRATGWWFALSGLANSLWIVFWHYGIYPLTLGLMLVLLASLIMIYRGLAAQGRPDAATRWLVQFPFSLYLGWISVATIANASAVLSDLGWDGSPLTPEIWTVVMLLVAAGLGVAMLYRHRDLAYAGVLVWAFAGILIKQSAYLPIVAASGLGIAALVVVAIAVFWRGATPALLQSLR